MHSNVVYHILPKVYKVRSWNFSRILIIKRNVVQQCVAVHLNFHLWICLIVTVIALDLVKDQLFTKTFINSSASEATCNHQHADFNGIVNLPFLEFFCCYLFWRYQYENFEDGQPVLYSLVRLYGCVG